MRKAIFPNGLEDQLVDMVYDAADAIGFDRKGVLLGSHSLAPSGKRRQDDRDLSGYDDWPRAAKAPLRCRDRDSIHYIN
jgi:hypothetical protein